MPSIADYGKYTTKPEEKSEGGGIGLGTILLIGLIAGGGIVFVLYRRRKQAATAATQAASVPTVVVGWDTPIFD